MKRFGFAVTVLVILGAGIWFYRRSETPKNRPFEKVVLNQAAKTLLYLPLYVAVDRGYLAKRGVEVTVVTAGGDSPAFAALAGGQAQFAQGDPTFAAVAHERGGPGVVIASVLDRVAFWGITFNSSIQPFADPAQFRNRTVVTFPAPNTSYVVQQGLAERAGLKLGVNTKITQAAFGAELGPVQNGMADIAMSIEPTVSQAEAQGGKIVYSYPDAWGPFLLTGLMTTEDFIKNKPEVVQAFVDAYEEAFRAIHSDPAAVIDTAVKYFPEVKAEVIRTAVKRLTDSRVFPEHARVDQASWKAALELRVKVGDLKSVAHDEQVNNSFADRATASTGK